MNYTLADTIDTQHPLLEQYSPLLAQLLVNRNIHTQEEAQQFITPPYESQYDPFLFHGMEKTITRIHSAISNNEHIIIYADYDADGIPGAVLLGELFEKIKYTNYHIYIPHRHDEGYGVHIDSLRERIPTHNTQLVITIDVGITAHEAGIWCHENNVDFIITDHHLPLCDENGNELLPKAYSIINPKQSLCSYPDSMLCGTGVIFKVVQAFISRYGKEFHIHDGWEKWLLDLVGIATISDMVPLVNENRIFAYYGLKVIKKTKRKGLRQLIWDSKINLNYITETDIAFSITPKINAASRMSHPDEAVSVFRATNDTEAKDTVGNLIRLNEQRKRLVAQTMKHAYKKIPSQLPPIIVIGSSDWQAGILGLVASKLVDTYKIPAFVWSEENGIIKGSCRSAQGIHLVELMQHSAEESFIQFGGHKEAGGFSCRKKDIHFLQERLIQALEHYQSHTVQTHEEVTPIDAELSLDDVHKEHYNKLSLLAPFGLSNPQPIFLFKQVVPISVQQFGKTKEHLEIVFKKTSGETLRAICFFKTIDNYSVQPKVGLPFNLVANIEHSIFMGKEELRLHIIDCLPE